MGSVAVFLVEGMMWCDDELRDCYTMLSVSNYTTNYVIKP